MTEDDIRYLFDSTETYPVSHEFIAKYITAPKKISVKKMIEQNDLNPITDYVVNINDEYRFTIDAFKYCIINYKLKFLKLFLNVENTISKERISNYQNKIDILESNQGEKNDIIVREIINNDIPSVINTETNVINEEISNKIENIFNILENINLQLNLLPEFGKQINNISSKLDHLLNIDINYSKKINSINIL